MTPRRNDRKILVALSVLAAAVLVWQMAIAQKSSPGPRTLGRPQAVTTQALGGHERYLTHLSTDKPFYRPGETAYVRGVILHHVARTPLPATAEVSASVEIMGPKGETAAAGYASSEHSVLGYSWTIPDGQPGGQYTIKVSYPSEGHPPAERKFEIRAYRAPRLKSQIHFLRDGYGPGDSVAATLEVERAEGGVPAGAKVTVVVRVDGQEVYRGKAEVDRQGKCQARFQLPAVIRRGEGTLAMIVEDGGVVETASKTIPILLQTVDLAMYPEGGDLVAGLPNRVYFEAFTPARKPADLAGIVVDADGREAARFRSEHEGRGRFELTPEKGQTYSLKILEPSGINTLFPLPQVQAEGAVIRADRPVYEPGEPITLRVGCAPSRGRLKVTLSKREVEVAAARVRSGGAGSSGLARVALTPPDTADGVLVATVWDADAKPLAERLVFRRPAESVHVKINPDAKQYIPGGRVKLTIETTGDSGKPMGAVVGLTVTDDSVLEMVEKREQAPRLPVMVLLENDVRELADAHVYLDPENPKAPLAVDLLLGTQGWRRFAFVAPGPFLEKHQDAARRALAFRQPPLPPVPQAGMPGQALRRFGAKNGPEPDRFLEAWRAPVAKPDGFADDERVGDKADVAEVDRELPPAALAEPAVPSPTGFFELAADAVAAEEEAPLGAPFGARARMGRPMRNDFVAVRVYAHQVRSGRRPGERIDFTETLFWHAGIQTDAQTGKAVVEFGLSDAVTSFRVFVDAFSQTGALGSAADQIESVEPFYLEPKLPLEVTAGDEILLPIGVVNATGSAIPGAEIAVRAHPSLDLSPELSLDRLDPSARVRRLLPIRVGQYNGEVDLTLSAAAGPYADKVTRTMTVKPQGFPVEAGFGGLLAAGGTATHQIEIPTGVVRDSMTSRAVVYPTPLANLTEALARLIREPYGCFEQTSSTTYPLVMAQQYFLSHTGVDPDLVRRSSETLGRGYERLVSFECENHGYEWFGADPGHEALTAYGLLEFTDMAEVRAVDEAMLQRTRTWLLNTRDGQGGFTRGRRALHTWITDPDCSNAYIMWVLLESGEKADLAREVAWVRSAAEKSQNTYVVALAANVLALAGDADGANRLLDRLAGKQSADGSLEGATTSIVGSGGEALALETTALAVLAWLKNPRYAANVDKSLKYIAEACKAGRFGSTQSTVLALRAIVEYDKARAKPRSPGSLRLVVDGQAVGSPVRFTEEAQGAIELPDVTELLTAGKHEIQVQMTGGSDMPYSLAIEYNTLKPATSEQCKVHLDVGLRDAKVDEGTVTEAHVTVVNRTGEAIPMTVAIVGIPGGLEVRHDQLKELVKSGKIAAYEVLGRQLVLYWRSLTTEQRLELPVSLVAAIPGRYTGPASRAYLYYTDEHKHWDDGLGIEITPRQIEE